MASRPLFYSRLALLTILHLILLSRLSTLAFYLILSLAFSISIFCRRYFLSIALLHSLLAILYPSPHPILPLRRWRTSKLSRWLHQRAKNMRQTTESRGPVTKPTILVDNCPVSHPLPHQPNDYYQSYLRLNYRRPMKLATLCLLMANLGKMEGASRMEPRISSIHFGPREQNILTRV